jgi:hypothetical protein
MSIQLYDCKHLGFEVQPPRSPRRFPLGFYVWGNFRTLMYWAPIESEGLFHLRICIPVKLFATDPRPVKVNEITRSGVFMRALIQVEHGLKIYCELCLAKQ